MKLNNFTSSSKTTLMRKAFIALGMVLMTAGAANAGGLVHKMSSSVQLTVDTARTTATRLGSQYSISGSNVNTTDGTTAGTITTGTLSSGIYSPSNISATQATDGEAFSFSASYIQGDAVPTSARFGRCSRQLLQSGFLCCWNKRHLSRYYCNRRWYYNDRQGAGTSAIGQFVSEITVID